MTFQTFTPIQYLMIDIANNFGDGNDRSDWDDRLNWFATNEHNLDELVKTASEPALFYAGVQAYRAALEGKQIGYPVSLDATSSGAQLLAVMIGCRDSAYLCNVLDNKKRMDLYTSVYGYMGDRLELPPTLTRKRAKDAIMPAFYGSAAMPKKIFGEGEVLEAFYQVMEEKTPGIWALNQALLGLWRPDVTSNDWIMPDNFHVHIKVMDDQSDEVEFLGHTYTVHSKVNRPTLFGLSIPANVTHSVDALVVREMERRCSASLALKNSVMELCLLGPTHTADENPVREEKAKKDARMVRTLLERANASGFLSARILDHITEDTIHLLDSEQRNNVWDLVISMPKKSFPILSVHDCFRVHPNNANDLRRQYNRIIHEIAHSKILEDLASQIAGEPVIVSRYGSFGDEILETNYALS